MMGLDADMLRATGRLAEALGEAAVGRGLALGEGRSEQAKFR